MEKNKDFAQQFIFSSSYVNPINEGLWSLIGDAAYPFA